MNKHTITAYYCRLAQLLNPAKRRKRIVILANVSQGTHAGTITLRSASAMTARNRLLAVGENTGEVQLADTSEAPIGVGLDNTTAAGETLAVALLGTNGDTHIGQASGSVSYGDFIVPAADGKVRTLPSAAGSYYIIGRALNDALNDQKVAYAGCMATLRVVPSES